MILRPYYNPRPLIEAASTAAFELRKFVRDLTIRDLERFSGLGSCASVGVLTQVQMSEDGAFVAASFDLSPKPEEVEVDAFHCAVPALEGYFRAEMALTDSLTLLVQTEAETSTLRRLGFDRVSDIQWLIWVGGRTRLSESVSLEFALGEDLSTMIAPDFTAYLGFRVELGGDRTKR